MNIYFNLEPCDIEANITLEELITQQGYAQKTIAVALNHHFISKKEYVSTYLQEGDCIDIVAPMQGG
jgi:sulfur carrier protein